jgi:hypothetical protein
MKRPIHRGLWLGLLCLIPGIAGTALADLPVLAIYSTGGHSCYPITEVQKVQFVDDTLVVVTPGTTDYYPLATIQRIDFSLIVTAVESPEVAASLPKILNLFPNQPNPLSSETKIAFRLPWTGHVELKIYGVSGRLVRTLVSGDRAAGLHSVVWDGLDDAGREAAAGVYFYSLTAPGIEESRQMILLR